MEKYHSFHTQYLTHTRVSATVALAFWCTKQSSVWATDAPCRTVWLSRGPVLRTCLFKDHLDWLPLDKSGRYLVRLPRNLATTDSVG